MNNIILYHANCADGFAAAFAAWLKFGPNAQYIPVSYGQSLAAVLPPPAEFRGDFAEVFILDFSFPREELDAIAARGDVARVRILDHHKTAAAALAGLLDVRSPSDASLLARFDMTKSGAVLAWEYFHPDKPVPEMLLYIQDRDLWQWQMPHSREINAGLWRGYAHHFETWKMIFDNWQSEFWPILHHSGDAILTSDSQMLAPLAAGAGHQHTTTGLCRVVNSPVLQSELGEKLLEDDPLCEYVDIWWDTASGRHHSLRSRKGGVDVSAIAAFHGGGGHQSAAGWREEKAENLKPEKLKADTP